MGYIEEYNELKTQPNRIEAFRSSGKDGIRIFSVLNSNIKALKTFGEYINTMYSVTAHSNANKQKIERVRAFNFRSIENHDDTRAINRSNIIIKAGNKFGGFDHAFVTLLLYILLLDAGDESEKLVNGIKKFINSLPIFIKRRLFMYSRNIALSDRGAFPADNLYQQIVVLYGDSDLYYKFIEYIKEYYPDEDTIKELFLTEYDDDTSPIYKRIDNFQSSALKKDALYTVIFYALDQFVRKSKMKGYRTGKVLVNAEIFLDDFLDYFNEEFDGVLSWLGTLRGGEDIDTLKDFISTELEQEEVEEIYLCIQNAFSLVMPEEEE